MRYQPLSAEFYTRNRRNVVGEMLLNSVAVLVSHDEYPRCGDTTHPFRQNSDLLYLCGIDQEDTILMMAPWHPNPEYREVLFIKNPSPEKVIWFGHRLTKAEASALSGVSNVLFVEEFESVLHDVMVHSEHVYLHIPENPRNKFDFETREIRFANQLKKEYPLHDYRRLAPVIYPLRNVKCAEELAALKKACEITGKAFRRAITVVAPGKYEYEVEAEMTCEMIRNGATTHSFAPIIASGADTCILHYVKNDKQMRDGDLLLMDFGAEYANYAGDCSRTVPVNGKFTPRQRAVYEAVLAIYKDTIPLFKSGMTIRKINRFVFKRMDEELVKLGLYTQEDIDNQDPAKPCFKKYFMHGTSHFIGLDVHDVGEQDWVFQPGNVLSCEPGIYIAEENIGVRIETDVVVADTPVDLMADLPVEVDEIEQMMNAEC